MTRKRQKTTAQRIAQAELRPYELHDAQRALAQRCRQTAGAIVSEEGGGGKTGVARAFIELDPPALALFASPTVEHARKKAKEVGCELAGPFAYQHLTSIQKKIKAGTPVRQMTTHQFLKRELADVARMVEHLFAPLGDIAILLVVDEADRVYQSPKYARKLQELREAVPRLRILFLTASPGLDTGTKSASNRRQWAEAALGAPPVLLAYTLEERAAMRTAVNPRPPVPSAWKEVDLFGGGPPQLDDASTNMLTELLVGRALEPDVRDWTAIDNLVNNTLVKHLLDAGALLEHVGAPQPMRRAEHGALGEATQCHRVGAQVFWVRGVGAT